MKPYKFVWIMAGIWALAGCSDQGELPPDEAEELTASVEEAPAPPPREGPRTYTAFPDEFPPVTDAAVLDVPSALASFQLALVHQKHEEAEKRYRRLSALPDTNDRLRVNAGLQLVQHYLSFDPPEATGAQALLEELEGCVASPDVPDVLRAHHAWWRLVAYANTGEPVLQGQQSAYEAWRDTIAQRARHVTQAPIDVAPLLNALDRLMQSAVSAGKPSIERIDEVFTLMQGHAGRTLPELIRAIQLRRVHLARRERKFTDAFAHVRVLLALSVRDAESWAEAVDLVQSVMRDAAWGEDRIQQWMNYVQWGPSGEDGQSQTDDDVPNLLAATVASMAGSNQDTPPSPVSAHPQKPAEQAITSGFHCLLNGDSPGAFERFSDALRQGSYESDGPWCLLEGLAMAQALRNGHLVGIEEAVAGAVASLDENADSAFWRYRLAAFARRQNTVAETLIATGRADLALGLCRSIANRWECPIRGQAILELALQGCRDLSKESGPMDALACYARFGTGLITPEARIQHARHIADGYRNEGNIALALEQLGPIEPLWEGHALRDPALALLKATLLVRDGQSDEALPIVQQLVELPEIDEDHRTRARLLLGVVQVQLGHPILARQTLNELIEEKRADPRMRNYIRRASQIRQQLGS
jgi:tetratricopeptide (TPR) repeat protein